MGFAFTAGCALIAVLAGASGSAAAERLPESSRQVVYRRALQAAIRERTGLAPLTVYRAAIERRPDAAARLLLYARERGPEIIQSSYRNALAEVRGDCVRYRKSREDCARARAGAEEDRQRLEELHRLPESNENLPRKILLGVALYVGEVAESVLDPRFRESARRCGGPKPPEERCRIEDQELERTAQALARLGEAARHELRDGRPEPEAGTRLKEMLAGGSP